MSTQTKTLITKANVGDTIRYNDTNYTVRSVGKRLFRLSEYEHLIPSDNSLLNDYIIEIDNITYLKSVYYECEKSYSHSLILLEPLIKIIKTEKEEHSYPIISDVGEYVYSTSDSFLGAVELNEKLLLTEIMLHETFDIANNEHIYEVRYYFDEFSYIMYWEHFSVDRVRLKSFKNLPTYYLYYKNKKMFTYKIF